jgi:carbon storage regulator
MLVLTRRKNERIVIADKATGGITAIVTVTSTESGKARIGVEAGPEVAVHRAEIWERIYGEVPTLESFEAMLSNRLSHPATQMDPLPHLVDILHGDPVGRHD